jgi:parvulin-like peptidyl-prolyl isomerase
VFGCGQNRDKAVVANVNDDAITVAEFRRALLREYQSPARIDTLSLADKRAVLDRLIDESLIAQAARARRLDQDPQIQRKVENFRKTALVSELIERQVIDKIITEGKLRDFYRKYAGELRLRYIMLRVPPGDPVAEERARAAIQALWRRAQAGESFAKLAREASEDGNTAAKGGDLGYVRWGDLPADFQEQAFALDVGELSTPIRGKSGYYLLKLEKKVRGSFEEEKPRIKWQLKAVFAKTIRLRKEAYLDKLLGRYETEFRRGNYKRFASLVKRPRYPFENITGENRHLVLASFRDGEVTAGDLVDHLGRRGSNYRWDERNIDEWTRTLARRAVAVAEAERRGIDVYDVVLEYENKLLRERLEEIEVKQAVSVDQEEIAAYFEEHRSDFVEPEMVRVREILALDPVDARDLLRQVKEGKDFARLARMYTARSSFQQRDGDLGFFPRSKYPEIAKVAFSMKRRGEIAGPISVKEGYSIIQFMERRPARPKTLAESKEKIRNILLEKKRRERRRHWLEELRQAAQIEINETLLAELF